MNWFDVRMNIKRILGMSTIAVSLLLAIAGLVKKLYKRGEARNYFSMKIYIRRILGMPIVAASASLTYGSAVVGLVHDCVKYSFGKVHSAVSLSMAYGSALVGVCFGGVTSAIALVGSVPRGVNYLFGRWFSAKKPKRQRFWYQLRRPVQHKRQAHKKYHKC